MNVLLLTIAPKKSQKMQRDLIREFTADGHNLFVACPGDLENPVNNRFAGNGNEKYLFVKSGNSVGKVGFVKKVLNFLLTDFRYQQALKKALKDIPVDLVLYSTPPITLVNTISWVKKKNGAQTYLMLKDIFPQNAVDMGMMKKTGLMGLVWRYFRAKERKLYHISDQIGCMSPANCRYVCAENPDIRHKVGLCVNAYALEPLLTIDKASVREAYGIPADRTVFLYGGNLGKPQGLNYLVKVLRQNQNQDDRFFVVCGNGNDEQTLRRYIEQEKPSNVLFRKPLPPDQFDVLSRACDVGMVFLDPQFTIPNFPSRMLSIMLNAMPILAATDANTDVGEVIAQGNMGWWCESTDTAPFNHFIDHICKNPELAREKGKNARAYYETHYTSAIAYGQIMEGITHEPVC